MTTFKMARCDAVVVGASSADRERVMRAATDAFGLSEIVGCPDIEQAWCVIQVAAPCYALIVAEHHLGSLAALWPELKRSGRELTVLCAVESDEGKNGDVAASGLRFVTVRDPSERSGLSNDRRVR